MKKIFSIVFLLTFILAFSQQTITPPDTVKGHHETDFWGNSTGTVWCDGSGPLTCYYTKPKKQLSDSGN